MTFAPERRREIARVRKVLHLRGAAARLSQSVVEQPPELRARDAPVICAGEQLAAVSDHRESLRRELGVVALGDEAGLLGRRVAWWIEQYNIVTRFFLLLTGEPREDVLRDEGVLAAREEPRVDEVLPAA